MSTEEITTNDRTEEMIGDAEENSEERKALQEKFRSLQRRCLSLKKEINLQEKDMEELNGKVKKIGLVHEIRGVEMKKAEAMELAFQEKLSTFDTELNEKCQNLLQHIQANGEEETKWQCLVSHWSELSDEEVNAHWSLQKIKTKEGKIRAWTGRVKEMIKTQLVSLKDEIQNEEDKFQRTKTEMVQEFHTTEEELSKLREQLFVMGDEAISKDEMALAQSATVLTKLKERFITKQKDVKKLALLHSQYHREISRLKNEAEVTLPRAKKHVAYMQQALKNRRSAGFFAALWTRIRRGRLTGP